MERKTWQLGGNSDVFPTETLHRGFHSCILGVRLVTVEFTVKTVSIKVLLCY